MAEAARVIAINCEELGIRSLKGIECFKNLRFLCCWENELTSLRCPNKKLWVIVCDESLISPYFIKQHSHATIAGVPKGSYDELKYYHMNPYSWVRFQNSNILDVFADHGLGDREVSAIWNCQ